MDVTPKKRKKKSESKQIDEDTAEKKNSEMDVNPKKCENKSEGKQIDEEDTTEKKNSVTNSRNKDEEISWIEKQTLPKGSSPVVWDFTYASSSDEEFEGFFNRDMLLLSDVNESVTNTNVVAFFQGFECEVVSREAGLKKRDTVAVKFSSEESAVAALKKCKDARLMGQTVSLTRSVNPKYKSFRVKGFKKNQQPNDIRHHINSKFGQFGTILHYYFPSEEFCYLYMALKPEFIGKVVSVKGLQVKECQMKGKVTRSQLAKWTQERIG